MEGFIFIFILIAIFAIVAAIYGHKKEKERSAAIGAWARAKGYQFHPDKVRHFDDEYPSFKYLRSGSNRYAWNIVGGREGEWHFTMCDYHYETHSTDSKGNRQTHYHHFSCIFVQPDFPLSPMQIRREGFFDKIKSSFGFGDINFESAEFSRKFYVSGKDKRWVYDVVHNRTMEFLMAAPKITIESDDVFLSTRKDGRIKPEELDQQLGFALSFLELIPEHVKKSAL